MKFTIEIGLDNAAFEGDGAGPEVARILRGLADKLESGIRHGDLVTLRDINGNAVGRSELFRDLR